MQNLSEERAKQLARLRRMATNKVKDNLQTVIEREQEGIPSIEYVKTNSILDLHFEEGFMIPSVNVIAGSTGDGKSLMLLHLAYRASVDHKILYVSCENSIQTDYKRIKKIRQTYGDINDNNITYINILDQEFEKDTRVKDKDIIDLIVNGNFEMIFIDSYQIMFDKGEDGASLYKVGNELIKTVYGAAVESNTAVFLTWQLVRAKVDKIDDIDENDISQSMGIVRYATSMFVIKRNKKKKNDWKIKLIKSREDFIDNDPKDLLFGGKFTIALGKDLNDILGDIDI